jgi:predicted enzyme related to lactoylglutathione lyase
MTFYVDDLDLAHAHAIAPGADVASMPRDEPRGRTAGYRDPDGNVVGLTNAREFHLEPLADFENRCSIH